jgi:hypothetical protein
MRRANANDGEPGSQFTLCAITPNDLFKGSGRQICRQLLYRDRLMFRRAL